MPEWKWTPAKQRAAVLVAQDARTDMEIAAEIGIRKSTLELWKTAPEFQANVDALVQAFRDRIRARGIAIVENRVAALQRRWDLMQQVIAERAADPANAAAAGGGTGLVVKQIKGIGKGDDFQVVETFGVDTGLLSEMRAHELQAARELGQLTEKRDITSGGKTLGDLLAGLSEAEIERRIAQAEGRAPAADVSP